MANLPIFAVCITLFAILVVAGFIFTNLVFLFLRKLNDGARYCIGWIKTSWVLFNVFVTLWGASILASYIHGSFDSDNTLGSQLGAIAAIMEPVALSTLLVTQLEMALGFRYASGLTGEVNSITVPRRVARVSYVIAILLSLGRFAVIEYYVAHENSDDAVSVLKALHIILWFVLLAQAAACLVYTFVWCCPSKLTTVRNMLLAMGTISVIRHLFEFLTSIALVAQGELRALTDSFDYLLVLTVLFRPCTTFASLIIAWAIARKNEDGLWGDRIGGLTARPAIEMDPTTPLPPRRI